MATKQFYVGPSDASHTSTSTSPPIPNTRSPSPASEPDDLPYPAPLSSSAFLAPTFDPLAFLATSRPRHQTLEDLRADLAYRSKALDQELLELVDENYRDFVLLGSGLGDGIGSERLEGVRVGLMGWEREVRGLVGKVRGRREEVRGVVEELRGVRRERALGVRLVELHSRVVEMEGRLKIDRRKEDDEVNEVDDDVFSEDDEAEYNLEGDEKAIEGDVRVLRRMEGLVDDYEELDGLLSDPTISKHPFGITQKPRIQELRRQLMLELEDTRKAVGSKDGNSSSVLDILSLLVRMQADPH